MVAGPQEGLGEHGPGYWVSSSGVYDKAGVCVPGWDPLLLQNPLVEHHFIYSYCTKIKQLLFHLGSE